MTTPDWDHPPDVTTRHLTDHVGEPVGYNLGGVLYEQPPTSLSRQDLPRPIASLPTTGATVGLVLSVLGTAGAPLLSFLTVPLLGMGIVLSASTLTKCARREAAGRGRALAGLVIGVVGSFLMFILFLDFINGSTTLVSHP
jgi:hypothetical protein